MRWRSGRDEGINMKVSWYRRRKEDGDAEGKINTMLNGKKTEARN